MGSGIKKIAVNVVSACDLNQAHADVINYLYPDYAAYQEDVNQNAIRIDYYVCHDHINQDSTEAISSTASVFRSVPRGKQFQLNRIRTDANADSVDRFSRFLESLYQSWINNIQIQNHNLNHAYSLVINYSPKLQSHRAKYSYDRKFITELDIFNTIIYEPRWLKIDYDCYVTSACGFSKTVNFWQFMPYVTSDTFKLWSWYDLPDADQFILPLWLNQQALKVRSIDEL